MALHHQGNMLFMGPLKAFSRPTVLLHRSLSLLQPSPQAFKILSIRSRRKMATIATFKAPKVTNEPNVGKMENIGDQVFFLTDYN
jgi:1-pyrroline-5-carboxylate dehydrogenase